MKESDDLEEDLNNFEDILKKVGSYGRFQKSLLVFVFLPISVLDPYMCMANIFMLSTPDHGCLEPTVSSMTNMSAQEKVELTSPYRSKKTTDSCRMYSLSYPEVLENINRTGMNVTSYVQAFSSNWSTVPCQHGWVYDKSLYKRTVATEWDLVCDKEYLPSLGFTMFTIGSAVGAPIFGAMSDRCGRKKTYLVTSILGVLAQVLLVSLPQFSGFLISKTVHGLVEPSIINIPFILLTEIVAPEKRSYLNTASMVVSSMGLCLLALVAWVTADWYWLAWSCLLTSIPALVYNMFIPESPRWLLSRNRVDEANEILQKMARINKRDISKLDMTSLLKKCSEKEQGSAQGSQESLWKIFKKPVIIRNFLIMTFIWTVGCISYNGFEINVSNMHGNDFLNFFFLTLVEIPSYLLVWYVMETRLGRRWTTVLFLFLTAVFCILPMTASEDNTVFLIVASLFGKFGVSAITMVIYQQAAELYPTPVRSSGLSISGTISSIINIGAPSIVYLSKYGRHIPYTIFSALCFVAVFGALFVPETLNENLPQTLEDGENFGKNMVFFSLAKTKQTKSTSTLTLQEVSSSDLTLS